MLYVCSIIILFFLVGAAVPAAAADDWQKLYDKGVKNTLNGLYTVAEKDLGDAMKLAKGGGDRAREALTLRAIAELYLASYRVNDAIPLLERYVKLAEQIDGENAIKHPEYLSAIEALANIHRDFKNYDAAITWYRKAISVDNRMPARTVLQKRYSVKGLAAVERKITHYKSAIKLYKQVIAWDEKELGPDDLETASDIDELGLAYLKSGQYAEAENCYKHSLAIRQNAPKKKTPMLYERRILDSLESLHNLYRAQKLYKKDLVVLKGILQRMQVLVGPDDDTNIKYLNDYVFALEGDGQHKEALAAKQRIQEILVKANESGK